MRYNRKDTVSDSDTVSGSAVDRSLRCDDGHCDQREHTQQLQPSPLPIEDLLTDIIPADSPDAFDIPSDCL